MVHLSEELLEITVSHGRPWQLQDILVDGTRDILNFQPLHEDLLHFNRLTGELKKNSPTLFSAFDSVSKSSTVAHFALPAR